MKTGENREAIMKADKKIKVLGIAGSPVKGGNTDILLARFLKGASESGAKTEKICVKKIYTEKLYIYDLKIAPCDNCAKCWKTPGFRRSACGKSCRRRLMPSWIRSSRAPGKDAA